MSALERFGPRIYQLFCQGKSPMTITIGSTPCGRHSGSPIEQLGVRAALEALLDAGIDRERMGALDLGNFISGRSMVRRCLRASLATNWA